MSLTSITITPSESPLTILSLANAKEQLRLESSFTDEDDLITAYIATAVANCENYMNMHLQPKTMVLQFDNFQNYIFETYPLTVDNVKYYKLGNAVLTTVETSDYYITRPNTKSSKLVFKPDAPTDEDYNRPDAVIVTCSVGYTDAADIPEPIIQAIKLQVSDMYERREDRAEIPVKASQGLMRPYRNYL